MTDTVYFLFGNKAVDIMTQYGVDALLYSHKEIGTCYEVFEYNPYKNTPVELISSYDGWLAFMVITEEVYDKLT